MPVFRRIQIGFWQDPFILELNIEEKYFYLYLITNSKTKQCGIYEFCLPVMILETGLEQIQIEAHMKKFQNLNKIDVDENTNEIMILNWVKHNYSNSPKVQICIRKELTKVKSTRLLDRYHTIVKEYLESIDTSSQEEKEEEKKEIKEDEKEKLLFNQETDLFSILELECNDADRTKCRRLLIKYKFQKVKDAFLKAADIGPKGYNLNTVEKILKEI